MGFRRKLSAFEGLEKRKHQRDFLENIINRPVDFLIKHDISPNILSFVGLTLSITAAILLICGILYYSIYISWIIPFLIFWAGAFDIFDGEVARRTNTVTKSGAFLDSNLDRISDSVLILGLIYGGFFDFILGFIILFLVIMISYIRSRAENEGVNMIGVGRMERAERLLSILGAIILDASFYYMTLLILGSPITILIPHVTRIPVTPIFIIFISLFFISLLYTVAQRIIHTYKNLKFSDKKEAISYDLPSE